MTNKIPKKKVVIIGAGPAGITAAYELLCQSKDYHITILEESESIGGIAKTVNFQGNRMDLGGHRFISRSEAVHTWWKNMIPPKTNSEHDEISLEMKKDSNFSLDDAKQNDLELLKKRRISRVYYQGKLFDYPIKLSISTLSKMGLFTSASVAVSYLFSAFHKRKEHHLEDYYINHFGKKLYQMFFEDYTCKLWGKHPSFIAADWGAQRIKGLSVLTVVKESIKSFLCKSSDKNQYDVHSSPVSYFWYPKLGPGQMWESAAERIKEMGGLFIMGAKANCLLLENKKVTFVGYQKDEKNQRIQADIVISSMPVCDLIAGMKGVPAEIKKIAKGLPYRDYVIVGILADELLIGDQELIKQKPLATPDCWIYIQDKKVKTGRIQIYNNWSKALVKDATHTVWLGVEYFCQEGDENWMRTDEEWGSLAINELCQMGFLRSSEAVLATHTERVKKAYPAYFGTYPYFFKLRSYFDSIEGLYPVGRNGQHRYNNMDHSMLTAFAAVEHILQPDTDASQIWRVNEDPVYQEEE